MKVGRNEQCPCGSGKKYKRCCLEKDRMASVSDLGARDRQGRPIGRPEIDAIYQGHRVRAVGQRLYFRPPEETKQEFFVHVLAHTVTETLGDDWKAKQDPLPMAERHPLALWTDAWDEMRRDYGAKARDRRDEGGGQYSSTATGDALALLTLAYDVYTLRHAMAIAAGDPLIKRLGQREQFQGARYEIAVAAIFVRSGYKIEWLTDTSRKLPEFIARRDGSDIEIAVEAKSRPRPGLLGQAGERPNEESVKADLARLHRDALEKETDGRPLVVFLDMNLPPGQDKAFDEWVPTLHKDVLAWRGESSAENPDPYGAVILTNFSWHWHGEEDAGAGERFIVLPLYSEVPLPGPEADRIWEAVNDYGRLPER
jgi:hypothetical protein